jgi:hypothetical protein
MAESEIGFAHPQPVARQAETVTRRLRIEIPFRLRTQGAPRLGLGAVEQRAHHWPGKQDAAFFGHAFVDMMMAGGS